MNTLRTKQSLGKVLFAGRGTIFIYFRLKSLVFKHLKLIDFQGMKLSKGAKSNERIILISENFVIKIDPNKKYKVMEKEPFSVISGISIFNFQDSKVGKYKVFLSNLPLIFMLKFV